MTALTLFDLVIRSMRKNIKHYYLYFFALIFSVVLYFVFATLQHDPAVIARSGGSMGSAFMVAGVLLIFIAGIFVVYANAIFLKRRSREIGLYQLIGLTKGAVARLLIIENALLGAGALVAGIGIGLLVSRVFLLLLMKLVGQEGFIALTFSTPAIIQTAVVFVVIIALTSIQMLSKVYRNTLLGLFNADKASEHPKKTKTFLSALLALLGIGLIVFGYWLSAHMLNELLVFNMIAVLVATILGTYLVFRVTISWLFYQIRKWKDGHLGLHSSLSLAPLMHRLKGNANSLTVIAVLSAMTLTMIAGAYSLYYSTEKNARNSMPYDFTFGDYSAKGEVMAEKFIGQLEKKDISYMYAPLEYIQMEGDLPEKKKLEIFGPMVTTNIISEKQLRKAGIVVDVPDGQSAVFYDAARYSVLRTMNLPFTIELSGFRQEFEVSVSKVGEGSVLGYGAQLVVNDAYYNELRASILESQSDNGEFIQNNYIVNVADPEQRAQASEIFMKPQVGYDEYPYDYHTAYKNAMQVNGLLIFIAGFLGLVFLISTGSILYFKQMTEAEQEKQSYATLRQLGFTVQDIMRGIVRKQVFVFGLPLAIGLLHSIFAIKAASFLFMSPIIIPATIAMSVYVFIYLIFAFLTVGYYRRTVKAAL